MNIILIIQARMSSTRLPGKVLKKIEDKTVLQHCIDRCSKSKYINKIIIATTTNNADDAIKDYCTNNNILYYRGSENNVLKRFYDTACKYSPDIIVRLTSDCPLIDVNILDDMMQEFIQKNMQFLQPKYSFGDNQKKMGGFPDGCNPQIFTFDILKETYANVTSKFDKEHVCPYMVRNYTNLLYNIPNIDKYKDIDLSTLHLSLDTSQDYKLICAIFKKLYKENPFFTIYDVLNIINNKSISLDLIGLNLYF